MTYPTQPGQPGGWSDPSWPNPEQYQDPSAQSGPPAYEPYSAPPGYNQAGTPGYNQAGTPGYNQAGYPQQYIPSQPYQGYPAVRPQNGMAVAALVCSILGFFICGVPSIVGAVLGHIARRQIAERGESGDGMALAGIIIGWIVFALYLLVILMYVGIFAAILGSASSSSSQDWENLFRAALAFA